MVAAMCVVPNFLVHAYLREKSLEASPGQRKQLLDGVAGCCVETLQRHRKRIDTDTGVKFSRIDRVEILLVGRGHQRL